MGHGSNYTPPQLNVDRVRRLIRVHQANTGISMRAFARESGLDPSNLSKFLSGQIGMSGKAAAAVARTLDIEPITLYDYDDVGKPA